MMGRAATLVAMQLVSLLSMLTAVFGQQGQPAPAGIYAGDQPDSCGYGPIPPSVTTSAHLASLSGTNPLLAGLPLQGCGACVQVTCTDPAPGVCLAGAMPAIVQVVDTSSEGMQLNMADMDAVSPEGNRLGHVDVSLQQVNCPAEGPILVRLQQLSPNPGGYIKLALLNVAGSNGITSVGFAPSGSQAFAPLMNECGAVCAGSLPTAPPLDMQVASGGQTLVFRDLITAATTPGDLPSTVSFTADPSLDRAAAPGTSALPPMMTTLPSPASASATSPASSPALSALPAALPAALSPNASSAAAPAALPLEASPLPVLSPSLLGASPAAAGASPPAPAPGSQEPLPATPANGTLFNLAGAASGRACSTIFDTLRLSPDLSTWVSLIQSKGLQFNLNGNNQGITMFAPINNAFSAPLLAGIPGIDNAQTIGDLSGAIPDIVSDLLGYSVVPQRLVENQLLSGGVFNTTNVIKTGNGVNGVPAFVPIDVRSRGASSEVVGVGSVATILQANIQACGSVIHIISNALLPFNVRTLNLPPVTPLSPITGTSPASMLPTAMAG